MQYAFPQTSEIRRVWPRGELPHELSVRTPESMAIHEAGHVVIARCFGIEPIEAAVDGDQAGYVRFPTVPPKPADEPDDLHAALGLAAILHAGLMAEMILISIPWRGWIARDDRDFDMAQQILSPHKLAGCGHAYAQRIALCGLTDRWGEVKEIAGLLAERQYWTNEVKK